MRSHPSYKATVSENTVCLIYPSGEAIRGFSMSKRAHYQEGGTACMRSLEKVIISN